LNLKIPVVGAHRPVTNSIAIPNEQLTMNN